MGVGAVQDDDILPSTRESPVDQAVTGHDEDFLSHQAGALRAGNTSGHQTISLDDLEEDVSSRCTLDSGHSNGSDKAHHHDQRGNEHRNYRYDNSDHDHSHDHNYGHDHAHDHDHDHDYNHDHSHDHTDHDHDHDHDGCTHSHDGWRQYAPHSHSLHTRLTADKRALTTALMILIAAFVLQLGGALVAKSSLLAVESLHSLVDSVTVVLSLISTIVAASLPTSRFTYGYGRAEVLSAMLSLVALAMLCVKLGLRAIRRVIDMSRGISFPGDVNGRIVVLAESVTLVANIGMAIVLSRHHKSLNVRAVRAHIIADSFENIVVLVAGVIMWVVPGATWIDPVFTIFVVVLLLSLNWRIARETLSVLMQAAPAGVVDDIFARVEKVPAVVQIKSLHVWTVTTGVIIGTIKTTVIRGTDSIDMERVRQDITEIMQESGVDESCVEVCFD